MKLSLLKATLMVGTLAVGVPSFAQMKGLPSSSEVSFNRTGGFSVNLRGQNIVPAQLADALPQMLGLVSANSFKEVSRSNDELGYTHITYQQYYKGISVNDGLVFAHLKDGFITSINGSVLAIPEDLPMPVSPISAKAATAQAAQSIGVASLIKEYKANLTISSNRSGQGNLYDLTWKVRIDGRTKDGHIKMEQVFVDAATGAINNHYPLIHDVDIDGQAETLYRGVRTITVDSLAPDSIRLRDGLRGIRTFNAGGVQPDQSQTSSNPFMEDVDYYNPTSYWGEVPTLSSLTIDSLADPSILTSGQLLAIAVGEGIPTADIANGSYLNTDVLFPPPTSLPIVENGLYLQTSSDSLYGLVASANIDFATFQPTIVDSLFFQMPDTSIGQHIWSDLSGNKGSYTFELKKNPALDAHWGMEQTYDYYLDRHNRNSYDNQGGLIRNYVNGMVAYSGTQNNAAALPSPYNAMVYGMGDGQTLGPVVGLDVMGHEFTHMVTDNNGHGGLNYQDESGALNESISDMMATAIEFFADSTEADWTIGEQVALLAPGYMRSMSDPKGPANVDPNSFQRQPDTYLGQYWYIGTQDNGGVHINSGVTNKWFYLISVGGTGVNDNNYDYDVTGLGIDKAEKIVYRTLMNYLTPSAGIMDMYNATLIATEDLYGAGTPEYDDVVEAWLAVGVPSPIGVGIEPVSSSQSYLKVFPNPATDEIHISSTLTKDVQVSLYDMMGRLIRTVKVASGSSTINVGDLSRGTYLMKYQVENKNYSEKVSLY